MSIRSILGALTLPALVLSLGLLPVLLAVGATRTQGGTDPTVSIGSATVPPGGVFTVYLTVTPPPGGTVGAIDALVHYNNTVIAPSACSPGPPQSCSIAYDPNTVSFSLYNLNGMSGQVGSITFLVVGPNGSQSDLDLSLTVCADTTGTIITCAALDGTVTVTTPPPTPTPVYGANFTVDSTVDAVDANPGDGFCATGGGDCTLRAAIQEADALLGEDTIDVPAGTYTLSIAGAY